MLIYFPVFIPLGWLGLGERKGNVASSGPPSSRQGPSLRSHKRGPPPPESSRGGDFAYACGGAFRILQRASIIRDTSSKKTNNFKERERTDVCVFGGGAAAYPSTTSLTLSAPRTRIPILNSKWLIHSDGRRREHKLAEVLAIKVATL